MKFPREVALKALLWCDQFDAELERGEDPEYVLEALRAQFQGWLDEMTTIDAGVALASIRAYANELLSEEAHDE